MGLIMPVQHFWSANSVVKGTGEQEWKERERERDRSKCKGVVLFVSVCCNFLHHISLTHPHSRSLSLTFSFFLPYFPFFASIPFKALTLFLPFLQ
ncbi:hypothetical protein BDB00DRAFT_849214 [Zychaea mexicana]|uniref:uncharacterized protein n=1 Tax=Zychaea mexicana TaxID=64656 RepID=UPI0022FE3704|nr:uncharacterized protein BDB00DRAFT_849214 [Zychaea mexicana]KAI9488247.1 hypothetical protein BDB00DRAFT_849214 [Zychaea mexicana]